MTAFWNCLIVEMFSCNFWWSELVFIGVHNLGGVGI